MERNAHFKSVNVLKKTLRRILLAPVLLVLLFEEWSWASLARAFAKLGRLPLWIRLESRIKALPPWAALLAFGVPVVTLVPIKFLALYLFSQGHMATGLTLVIAAKVTGTATAARLFQLTEPALMRMAWFARIYLPWKRWKDGVLTQVKESLVWRSAHRWLTRGRLLGAVLWSAVRRG